MKNITFFYLDGCPYCGNAHAAIEELTSENPAYAEIPIEKIEENTEPEKADAYDYYHVPTFFIGTEKLYECSPADDYAAIKAQIKGVFDAALEE